MRNFRIAYISLFCDRIPAEHELIFGSAYSSGFGHFSDRPDRHRPRRNFQFVETGSFLHRHVLGHGLDYRPLLR